MPDWRYIGNFVVFGLLWATFSYTIIYVGWTVRGIVFGTVALSLLTSHLIHGWFDPFDGGDGVNA